MGVELETYSIALPECRICRELHFPKKSLVEEGERFTRDDSIGSEYNSRVFATVPFRSILPPPLSCAWPSAYAGKPSGNL